MMEVPAVPSALSHGSGRELLSGHEDVSEKKGKGKKKNLLKRAHHVQLLKHLC